MKYSNAQIRGAILRAADRIERDPDSYYFGNPHCGARTNCAYAKIGEELGYTSGAREVVNFLASMLGLEYHGLFTGTLYDLLSTHGSDWAVNGLTVVPAIRAIANRYFPAEKANDPAFVKFMQSLGPKSVSEMEAA